MILHVLIAMVAGWLQRHQQQVITYLLAENRVLKTQLGGRRLRLTATERRRLAALAYPLGRKRLKEMATLVTPETLMRWYHRLIAHKFDGSTRSSPLGRPPVAEEVERLAVQMAEENPTWGYRRIQGALANLGHQIDKSTVRNILRRHHLEPAPQRRKVGMSWAQFLRRHWEVLAATDFFTVEVATWHGLVTYYVLVVMELATRRVQVAGITPHPTAAFMQQCARHLTAPFEGFLVGKRYLLHDRDTKFTQAFDGLLKASGVEPIVLPPRSPNLNAHCERFVRSIKEEALEQMVMLGERTLYYAIHQYLAHYHTERNHQGLDNQLIAQEGTVGCRTGHVVRRERLGGLLSYYHREAAGRDAVFQLYEVRGCLPARPAGLTARFAGLRFVDVEGTPPKRLALEPLNGGLCRTGVRHLHKTKPTGLAGVTIGNDMNRVHNTIRLEELAEVMISGVERKITNKNVHARILL